MFTAISFQKQKALDNNPHLRLNLDAFTEISIYSVIFSMAIRGPYLIRAANDQKQFSAMPVL